MPFDFLKQALAKKKAAANEQNAKHRGSNQQDAGSNSQVISKRPAKKSAGRGR